MKLIKANGEVLACQYCRGTEFYEITEGTEQTILECDDVECGLTTKIETLKGEKFTLEMRK